MLFCIGGGDIWDLPEFNFISICTEKKLNNPVIERLFINSYGYIQFEVMIILIQNVF